MKKATQAAILLFIPILTGCVSAKAGLDPELVAEIPDEANVITLYSDSGPEGYFRTLYQGLTQRGYTMAQENMEMHTLTTNFIDVDQGTTLRIALSVLEDQGGSRATLRGFWSVTGSTAAGLSAGFGINIDQDTGERAEWGKMGRPGAAFGQLARLARDLPQMRREYHKE